MFVTGFSASPRRGGNSDTLVDRILAGAKEGGADVRKVRLHPLDIRPCRACESCKRSFEARCAVRDDMAGLLELLVQSDGIVFGAPIYFFSVAAQMKLFLDRTYALGGDGRWDALAGRRMAVALTYGDESEDTSGVRNAIGMFRDAAAFLGLSLQGFVCASCDKPGEVRTNEAVMAAAFEAGRRLFDTQ